MTSAPLKPFAFRVLAPLALLASASALLFAGLVLAVACRRTAGPAAPHGPAAVPRDAVLRVCAGTRSAAASCARRSMPGAATW